MFYFLPFLSSSILYGQHYIKLGELEKNRKLNDLLDALDFNQVVIFVKSVNRASELNKLLVECNFPSICIHSGMSQEDRYIIYLLVQFRVDSLAIVSAASIINCDLWLALFSIIGAYNLFYD